MLLRPFKPRGFAESVFDLDFRSLYAQGFRGLIFDIDNTLVPHGADSTPEVDALFAGLAELGFRSVMVSNNGPDRIRRFLKNIDADFIDNAGKPRKKGYLEALRRLNLPARQVLCIGDQVFTDVLGANRCGIPTILVRYIGYDPAVDPGKRRRAEAWILRHTGGLEPGLCAGGAPGSEAEHKPAQRAASSGEEAISVTKERKLFCERNALFFKISQQKGIWTRRLRDAAGKERFAVTHRAEPLPNEVTSRVSHLIKRAPGVDPTLQENKAVNIRLASQRIDGLIIRPGETFSFWRTIGRTSKRKGYLDGRVIEHGKLVPGTGGGLCNLGNTIHLLVLHSPLTVTEFHHHSDALAPDEGPRVPFSAGTSVCYNYIDYRFRNDTDQDLQLCLRVEGEELFASLRSERPFPWRYALAEEDHHFQKEGKKYYRVSKIYQIVTDAATGEQREKKLILDNHSEVMFDPALIPSELLREE